MEPRKVVATAVAAAAFAAAAVFAEEPGRTPAIQGLTYVLAWRLTSLIPTSRRASRWVILSLPLLGGAWIGEWWAPALASVNLVLFSLFRRKTSGEPLTWPEVGYVFVAEALLLAVGVGVSPG